MPSLKALKVLLLLYPPADYVTREIQFTHPQPGRTADWLRARTASGIAMHFHLRSPMRILRKRSSQRMVHL